jgi:sterol desaturase/sphingolipid hydroxylase (fatty acid hydroxylase superfamily)
MVTEQVQLQTLPRKPFRVYKREQAAISRHTLYPVTAIYTLYSVTMLVVGFRSGRPLAAFAFFLGGIPVWTLFEYSSHRFVLHGHFKRSKHKYKVHKALANKYLDPLHWEHHERPFDGKHINGEWTDMLPIFGLAILLSFLLPVYSAPMLMAGVVQSYVLEEWVHHSVHYYNFRNPYFKYIRKHHIYHHTSSGMERGFGFTSGIWDIVFKTRFPEHVRDRLYGRGKVREQQQTERIVPQP